MGKAKQGHEQPAAKLASPVRTSQKGAGPPQTPTSGAAGPSHAAQAVPAAVVGPSTVASDEQKQKAVQFRDTVKERLNTLSADLHILRPDITPEQHQALMRAHEQILEVAEAHVQALEDPAHFEAFVKLLDSFP